MNLRLKMLDEDFRKMMGLVDREVLRAMKSVNSINGILAQKDRAYRNDFVEEFLEEFTKKLRAKYVKHF